MVLDHPKYDTTSMQSLKKVIIMPVMNAPASEYTWIKC